MEGQNPRLYPLSVEARVVEVYSSPSLISPIRWGSKAGIPREEVMAIGDYDNDGDMVTWAGFGVAVGNASPRLLAVADEVVPPLDEDGAAVAIERYVVK